MGEYSKSEANLFMLLKKDTENVHGQSKGTQDIAEQPEIT
jgi:hypothetical protein